MQQRLFMQKNLAQFMFYIDPTVFRVQIKKGVTMRWPGRMLQQSSKQGSGRCSLKLRQWKQRRRELIASKIGAGSRSASGSRM